MSSLASSMDLDGFQFKWPEYVVFVVVLTFSTCIGFYYGCVGKKQTTSDYLLGDRRMGVFPVSMSLLASFTSAISTLGLPTEVYLNGASYWLIGVAMVFMCLATAYLYIPVFFNLRLTSVYEYLELRFGVSVRRLVSIMVAIQMTAYMAIVVYAPSLALTHLTGTNVFAIVVFTFAICIFYTALGGMKAVLWTNTFQVLIMFGSLLCLMIQGTADVGGVGHVWGVAANHARLDFVNWSPDPRVRHSVWSVVLGGLAFWLSIYGCNQAQVQRFLTVPSIRQARTALWINLAGLEVFTAMCCFTGLVMFAKFQSCDPLTSKQVARSDQLVPLFVMQVLGGIPGLPGLFVGGVFAGSLSAVSSGLNSLPAMFLEDFVKPFYPSLRKGDRDADARATTISRMLAVIFGLLSCGFVFVIAQMPNILGAFFSLFGIISGPLLGVFSLGLFYPWANHKGAFIGTLTSLIVMLWIVIGTSLEVTRGNIVHRNLPLSTESCVHNFTLSAPKIQSMMSDCGGGGWLIELYRVSYLWYTAIGAVLVVIIGLLTSFLTGPQDPRLLNPKLISHVVDGTVRWMFPKARHWVRWDLGSKLPRRTVLYSTSDADADA